MQFAKSIATSRDCDDNSGALILFFSYCDAVGSLLRPKEKSRTESKYFKQFVGDFILTQLDSNINSDELWSARCGILHTYSPYSDLSEKEGSGVRKVVYVGSKRQADLCTEIMESEKVREFVFIDPYDLFNGFVDGIAAFLKEVEKNQDLRDKVLFHSEKYFDNFRFKIPQPDSGLNEMG